MNKYFFLIPFFILFQGIAQAQNAKPSVIPSLQKWEGGDGFFHFSAKTTLAIKNNDLKPFVEQFSKDIAEEYQLKNKVKVSSNSKNEISFSIGAKNLPEEGYIIDIQKDKVNIIAPNSKGIFWATRTLLQMFDNQGFKLPVGKIEDYPEYSHRGFMLDTGRKFFTIDYLRNYIKLLSYYKFNEFQVHLNDNGFPAFFDNNWDKTYSAFRLESDTYPGLAAKDGHYTKQEFRDLQKMGMLYGVNVIPEIDVPAHSLAFAKYRPEIASDKYGRDHLDLYNPKTYEFVDALYKEYISGDNPTFIGPDLHIGTDEYDIKESEKYREFTDRYLKYIQKLGKNVRMWDGLRWLKGKTPVQSENVIVNAWSHDWSDPFQSSKDGYKIISTCDEWLYIVPAAGYYRDFLDEKWLYENWIPEMINSKETLPKGSKSLLGGMFAVWNDHCGNGISQQDVHYRTVPAMKVLAQKMWNTKTDMPFQQFKKLADGMGECPSVNMLGRVKNTNNLVLNYTLSSKKEKDLSGNSYNEIARRNIKVNASEKALSFSGKSFIETPIADVGYDYSASFDLNINKNTAEKSVLFSSENSKVLILKETNGYKIGFERDGYSYEFKTIIPFESWANISISGDYKSTTLSVNGKTETLSPIKQEFYDEIRKRKSNMYYQQTLMFPLKYIGDAEKAFSGMMRNLKVQKTK